MKSKTTTTPKLIGEECDGTITYDHLCGGTDDPTPKQYKTMLDAAQKDSKKLESSKIKHTLNNGKGRNEMGLPYIELN